MRSSLPTRNFREKSFEFAFASIKGDEKACMEGAANCGPKVLSRKMKIQTFSLRRVHKRTADFSVGLT
jgi:hypothetical protein